MTPAPAPAPLPPFPTVRFSLFDRLASITDEPPLNMELVGGVWCLPAHVAAEALQVAR